MAELEERTRSMGSIIAVTFAALVVLAGIGAIGKVAGTGWFGYRQLLYGSGQLYLLNMSDRPLKASVDGREPVLIASEGADIVDIVGGQSRVDIIDESGEVVDERTVTIDDSDALLKLTSDACLVASNVDGYYRDGESGANLDFIAKLTEEQRVYVPKSKNVIWPRKKFPDRLQAGGGPGVWIELVGCPLLDEEEYLRAYLDVRLQDRLKKPEPRRLR